MNIGVEKYFERNCVIGKIDLRLFFTKNNYEIFGILREWGELRIFTYFRYIRFIVVYSSGVDFGVEV